MAIENNRKPLVDEALYREIRHKFALPKTESGKLRYISLYESKESVLAERFKALACTVSDGYEKDFTSMGIPTPSAQKLAKALAKEIYAVAWYGYMFCDRARDTTWEKEMKNSWEADYREPTYDPTDLDEPRTDEQ